jgi:hypothetical protein
MGIRESGIPRPFNPFLAEQNAAMYPPTIGALPPPRPRANPMPGAPPMPPAPTMADFGQRFDPALNAMAASAMPMPGAPQGGFMGGLKGGLNDFLGSDASLAMAAGLLGGGSTSQAIGRGFGNAFQARQKSAPASTDDIQEFAFAKSQGYGGDFPTWMREQKMAGAQKTYGAPPAGYRTVFDEYGNPVSQEPIPGSPAAQAAEAAQGQAAGRAESGAQSADIVLGAIDDAETIFSASPEWTTGLGGSIMLKVPGSGAVDLQEAIAPIEASIAFDRLQKMREESPTGGALGAVSERELMLLSATVASLKQSQSPEAFKRNLGKVKTVYASIAKKFAAYPNAAGFGFAPPEFYDAQQGGAASAAPADPLGIRQ